jgi:hypothetical protein
MDSEGVEGALELLRSFVGELRITIFEDST